MDHFLLTLFDMSIEACIVICIVLALRVLFRYMNLSTKYSLLLWIFPFFCMLCPWRLESPIAVIPSGGILYEKLSEPSGGHAAETIQENTPETAAADGYELSAGGKEEMQTGTSDFAANDKERKTQQEAYSAESTEIVSEQAADSGEKILTANAFVQITRILRANTFYIFILWLTGFLGVCLYGIFSCLALRKKLICSVRTDKNIYLADDVEAPFIFGVVRPKVYLPSGLSEEQQMFVLAHEHTHIKRKDYVLKICAFILTGAHWFNPFAWAAFILFANDLELACDEAAVKSLEKEFKNQKFGQEGCETNLIEISKRYAQTIVELSTGQRKTARFPIAFGKGNIKRRIQNIMKNKKPVFGAAAAAVFVIAILAGVVVLRNKAPENEPMEQIVTYNPKNGNIAAEMAETSQHNKEQNKEKTQENKEQNEEKAQEIAITGAEVSEEMPIGSDGTSLDYGDNEKLIFHDYYGLFVYSLRENKMKASVSLKDIGCGYTQGDRACELFATKNGTEIYMHPMDQDYMFCYNTEKDQLVKEDYSAESFSELEKQGFYMLKDINDCIDPNDAAFRSRYCATLKGGNFLYLESESGMAQDLCYVIGKGNQEEKRGSLFSAFDSETGENDAVRISREGVTVVRENGENSEEEILQRLSEDGMAGTATITAEENAEDGVLQELPEGSAAETTTTIALEDVLSEEEQARYEKEAEENTRRLFEEYEKYGITKEGDAIYYNGQRVSVFYDGYLFTDENQNSVSSVCKYQHYDEEGSVKVRAIRLDTVNPDGTVTLFGDLVDIVPYSAEIGEIVADLLNEK